MAFFPTVLGATATISNCCWALCCEPLLAARSWSSSRAFSTRSCLFQHFAAKCCMNGTFIWRQMVVYALRVVWFSALLTSRLFKLLRHSRRPTKTPFKNRDFSEPVIQVHKEFAKGIEASRFEKSFQPRGHAMTTHI